MLTEARVSAERTLSMVMQQHAVTLGLAEWAGQIVTVGDSWWHGGVELSPYNLSTSSVSMVVQELQANVEFAKVSCSSCLYTDTSPC